MSSTLSDGRFQLTFDDEGALTTLQEIADPRLKYVDQAVSGGPAFGQLRLGLDHHAHHVGADWTVTTSERSELARRSDSAAVQVEQRWVLKAGTLHFTTRIVGLDSEQVEALLLAIPFNTKYVRDPAVTYRERVVRHDDLVGSGGFCYITRADGDGPFLLLSPADTATAPTGVFADMDERESGWEGTSWIRFDRDAVAAAITDGVVQLALRFDWTLASHQSVRDTLFSIGALDVVVSPGMVVPTDLAATVAIRSAAGGITLDTPPGASVERLSRRGEFELFNVHLEEVGESTLTVRDADGRARPLRFFGCRPLETLLADRRDFILSRQQFRGDAWYDGLFSNWDMAAEEMTTPDRPLGLDPYMVGGSDDPTLCKAPLLAELSLVTPHQDSISAIDYYIDHFVVGGLQRVEEAPHAYGIYGTPNWHELRHADTRVFSNGGHGREHLWRTFDYPHLVQLYLLMSRIARTRPDLNFSRDADAYLTLATRTALAYFEVPADIFMHGWAINGFSDWAFKQGNFHEARILDVIDDLDQHGRQAEAAALREHWEAKVRYMLFDHPHPFGSEMYFDSTAFESTYVVGRYAVQRPPKSDGVGWFDRNANGPGLGAFRPHPAATLEQGQSFLASQARANMAARGMLETTWWVYGSDIRQQGTTSYMLSYMTGLGGWPLLEWGLEHPEEVDAATAIRAGYGAHLATFALIHSGADYPWWPDENNRGAAAWAFAPQADHTWMGRDVDRGPWPLDGEIDSGLSGAVRSARCILLDDDVFGVVALGGRFSTEADHLVLVPADGVRQRVEVLLNGNHERIDASPHRIAKVVVYPNDAWRTEVILDPAPHDDDH